MPDDQWSAAAGVVAEVAGQAGFGSPEPDVDWSGQHEVALRAEREALLRFGPQANVTLALETGCHRPESAG